MQANRKVLRARVDAGAVGLSRGHHPRAVPLGVESPWAEWSALNGHATLPAAPAAVAAYLAERTADGAAASTVRAIRAAIGAPPTVTRAPTIRPPMTACAGQAQPLTADDLAAILATATIPRRTGRVPSDEGGTALYLSKNSSLIARSISASRSALPRKKSACGWPVSSILSASSELRRRAISSGPLQRLFRGGLDYRKALALPLYAATEVTSRRRPMAPKAASI